MTGTRSSAVSKDRAREGMTRFTAAWERGDVSAVDEVFAEDLVYHGPPFPDMGRAELREFIASFRTGFSEFHVQVHEHVVDGTTSAHRWTAEAVFSGTTQLLPGVEPTGKHTSAEGARPALDRGQGVRGLAPRRLARLVDEGRSAAAHAGDGWLTNHLGTRDHGAQVVTRRPR